MPRHVEAGERRATIADAALRVAREEGFAAVTIRRVAEAMGASTTAVTHYVDGRDDLVRLAVGPLLERRQAEAEAAIAAARPEQQLRRLIAWVALDIPVADQQVWLDLVADSRGDSVLRELLDGFNWWWEDLVVRGAEAAIGAPADPARVAAVVDAVDVVADGIIVAAFDRGERWSRARTEVTLDRLLGPLGI